MVLEHTCAFISNSVGCPLEFKREQDTEPLTPGTVYLAKLHGSVDTRQIIPPTWNKALGHEIIGSWQLARKLLAEANQVRIIGYSLPSTDSYIRYLFRAAVVDAFNLKRIDVLCMDQSGAIFKRYGDFIKFRDWRFKNGRVEEYLNELLIKENKAVLSFDTIEHVHETFFL
jgi:hypothetical protein